MKHEDPAGAAVTNAPNVQNGTYTVSHPTQGHFTLKVYTVLKGDLIGKRIVSLLVGPDNTTNYRGVAFWDDARKKATVWRRHRGPDSNLPIDGFHFQKTGWSAIETKLAIWVDLAVRAADGFWTGEGYELQHAGRCVICNRKLTDPESIRLGIGPKCGGRS